MIITSLSDLHGFLPEIAPCDVVFICGDITPLHMQRNIPQSEKWLKTDFAKWINDLPCEMVYMVGGNHDFALANMYQDKLKKASVLYTPTKYKLVLLDNESIDSYFEDKKYTIWGTPYCKIFGNWAYMYEEGTLKQAYDTMPEKCDFVLTHDAPALCGVGKINQGFQTGVEAGNPWLADEILRKHPRYVFCGHIHSGEHILQTLDDIKLANVSVVNERYELVNEPLTLIIE